GPLIKSQMLYRLSYERKYIRNKNYCQITIPHPHEKSKPCGQKNHSFVSENTRSSHNQHAHLINDTFDMLH
ncbi:MAG: hypothetical protein ACI4LE_09220, partial [Faecalibacterium sp.]